MQQMLAYIQDSLRALYTPGEARTIAFMLMERATGLSHARVLVNKDTTFPAEQRKQIVTFVEKLREGVPVQYVLGEAEFYGLRFEVNEAVLIPRPETEELVEWVERDNRSIPGGCLLDVGTGSGCIAVTLKRRMLLWQVDAFDISADALAVAARNARRHGVEVRFRLCDILQPYPGDEQWDVVVSNPPYIPEREKAHMARQVLAHEPARALFVPDGHPLLFYEHIGAFAWRHLSAGGRLYFEIHYDAGAAVVELLRSLGFAEVELRRDLAGHDRMVKAVR